MPAIKTAKNREKNREKSIKNDFSTAYSTADAARFLGVSTPTIKRMVQDGEIEGVFYTPGGHLRIPAERLNEIRSEEVPPAVENPSSVLQQRRERIEEMALETEELRAKHQRDQVKRQLDEDEAQRRGEEEARARREERRQAEAEAERRRLERKEESERQKQAADRELQAFQGKWRQYGEDMLLRFEYNWLSAGQRKQVSDAILDEVTDRDVSDEARMSGIIAQVIAATVEPWNRERAHNKRCEDLLERLSWLLPRSASREDLASARTAASTALQRFGPQASNADLEAAVEQVIAPVRKRLERAERIRAAIHSAVNELPFSCTSDDQLRFRRKCEDALSKAPDDVSEYEAKRALKSLIREASEAIEGRERRRQNEQRKPALVQLGVNYADRSLARLTLRDEIDSEDAKEIRDLVRDTLEDELGGGESETETRQIVERIMDQEI